MSGKRAALFLIAPLQYRAALRAERSKSGALQYPACECVFSDPAVALKSQKYP